MNPRIFNAFDSVSMYFSSNRDSCILSLSFFDPGGFYRLTARYGIIGSHAMTSICKRSRQPPQQFIAIPTFNAIILGNFILVEANWRSPHYFPLDYRKAFLTCRASGA